MRGRDTGERRSALRWLRWTPVLALLLAACSGSGPQTSLEPAGPIADDIDGLWLLVFWLAVGVFVVVMAVYVFAIFHFRERRDDERRPRQIHGNTRLEIMWTIAPAVLLAIIAVPTVRTIFEIRDVPAGEEVLEVDVIGHQWWWEFTYPDLVGDDGRPLVTANELHIPADRTVNLTMTSTDVIHSFWVPPLNGKRDVVPGRFTNLTLEAYEPTPPGEPIFGQCAEFCGLAHADMRLRVFVHDAAGFDGWVADQLEPAAVPDEGTLAANGWQTFNLLCTACHNATVRNPDGAVETLGPVQLLTYEGVEFASALAPDLTHFGSRSTFAGAVYDNDPVHLAAWLENPSALKPMEPERNDIPAGRILGMPNFGLSVDEIEGLVALLEGWE